MSMRTRLQPSQFATSLYVLFTYTCTFLRIGGGTEPRPSTSYETGNLRTYNVTLRRVRATIFAVEEQ